MEPTKLLYTAREDTYFLSLTGEVKCGQHGLELANRPNTHSIIITLHGVVDIYRRIKRPSEVQREEL